MRNIVDVVAGPALKPASKIWLNNSSIKDVHPPKFNSEFTPEKWMGLEVPGLGALLITNFRGFHSTRWKNFRWVKVWSNLLGSELSAVHCLWAHPDLLGASWPARIQPKTAQHGASWWLNHPSEKICSSNSIMNPQFFGVKIAKNRSKPPPRGGFSRPCLQRVWHIVSLVRGQWWRALLFWIGSHNHNVSILAAVFLKFQHCHSPLKFNELISKMMPYLKLEIHWFGINVGFPGV